MASGLIAFNFAQWQIKEAVFCCMNLTSLLPTLCLLVSFTSAHTTMCCLIYWYCPGHKSAPRNPYFLKVAAIYTHRSHHRPFNLRLILLIILNHLLNGIWIFYRTRSRFMHRAIATRTPFHIALFSKNNNNNKCMIDHGWAFWPPL